MEIKLKHKFLKKCRKYNLLEGVNSLKEFCKKIETLAELELQKYIEKEGILPSNSIEEYLEAERKIHEKIKNDFKGSGFELFVEMFLKEKGTGPINFYIRDYESLDLDKEEDWGVDGIGKDKYGGVATVQAKYASNHMYLLTAGGENGKGGISNFVAHSDSVRKVRRYVVVDGKEIENNSNLLVITTAKGLTPTINEKMYGSRITVINYEMLERYVADSGFWDNFRNSIKIS